MPRLGTSPWAVLATWGAVGKGREAAASRFRCASGQSTRMADTCRPRAFGEMSKTEVLMHARAALRRKLPMGSAPLDLS